MKVFNRLVRGRRTAESRADNNSGAEVPVVQAVVLYGRTGEHANEMTLHEGEVITNIEQGRDGWWYGESDDGTRRGYFAASFVKVVGPGQPLPRSRARPDRSSSVVARRVARHAREPPPVYPEDIGTGIGTAAVPGSSAGHGVLLDDVAPPGTQPMLARVISDFTSHDADSLSLRRGQMVHLLEEAGDGYWKGSLGLSDSADIGYFPASVVQVLDNAPLRRGTDASQYSSLDMPSEQIVDLLNSPRLQQRLVNVASGMYHTTTEAAAWKALLPLLLSHQRWRDGHRDSTVTAATSLTLDSACSSSVHQRRGTDASTRSRAPSRPPPPPPDHSDDSEAGDEDDESECDDDLDRYHISLGSDSEGEGNSDDVGYEAGAQQQPVSWARRGSASARPILGASGGDSSEDERPDSLDDHDRDDDNYGYQDGEDWLVHSGELEGRPPSYHEALRSAGPRRTRGPGPRRSTSSGSLQQQQQQQQQYGRAGTAAASYTTPSIGAGSSASSRRPSRPPPPPPVLRMRRGKQARAMRKATRPIGHDPVPSALEAPAGAYAVTQAPQPITRYAKPKDDVSCTTSVTHLDSSGDPTRSVSLSSMSTDTASEVSASHLPPDPRLRVRRNIVRRVDGETIELATGDELYYAEIKGEWYRCVWQGRDLGWINGRDLHPYTS